jgi:hypothetical protein
MKHDFFLIKFYNFLDISVSTDSFTALLLQIEFWRKNPI